MAREVVGGVLVGAMVCSLAFTMLMLALPVFVPPYDPWPTPLGNRTSYTFVESGVRTYNDG